MDSLTQITLGAAVGELVAGKKLGNRAMLWGAVAGTIPDMDVFIGSLFMDDLGSLAFHRGFMHSFTFALLFSIFMTFLVKRIYDTDYYQKNAHKLTSFITALLLMLFMALIMNFIPVIISGKASIFVILAGVLLLGFFVYRLWKNYFKKSPLEKVRMSGKHWYLFFLLTIVTHPILDCFTTYGTQIFQPFSDIRIAWDNISVFDPGYTAPFLICLMIAAFLKKGSNARSAFNIAGIVLSSIYMIWTFGNKKKVNDVFENTLASEQIDYSRYKTTPTIANNFLWHCVAETDSFFFSGFYSLLDKEPIVKDMIKVPIHRKYIKGHEDDESIQTLQWFSNGYLSFVRKANGSLQANDLRFGRFTTNNEDMDSYIFNFTLVKNENQEYKMVGNSAGPPENQEGWVTDLLQRIKGI